MPNQYSDIELPSDLHARAVAHLRDVLAEDTFEEIRQLHAANPEWWAEHHFFMGMRVRNLLREIIKDDELPPVDYGNGESYSNWDDYYIPVLEEAAGCRT